MVLLTDIYEFVFQSQDMVAGEVGKVESNPAELLGATYIRQKKLCRYKDCMHLMSLLQKALPTSA